MKKDIRYLEKLAEPGSFCRQVEQLAEPIQNIEFDKIAAIEALGFPLGGALAAKFNKDLVLIRKGSPDETKHADKFAFQSFRDHSESEKTFRILKASINKGDKIALIDEHSQTVAQIQAAATLIKHLGATVVIVGLVSADSKAQHILEHSSSPCQSVIVERSEGKSGLEHEWDEECRSMSYW